MPQKGSSEMITDGQIHLWPADGPHYPWPEGAAPDTPEPLTAERFLHMMDDLGVDRAIIAPPAVSGFDPSYALDCATNHPERLAVTSRWDFSAPDAPSCLATWLDSPGMIGIRIALLPSAIEGLKESKKLPEFFATAEEFAIPLMVFAPGTIREVEAAAKAHPNLKLVVDHANLVGSTPNTVGERINELITLAQYDNIAVKLGALPLRSAQKHPYADLHPHLHAVYHAFGAQRLIWASDLSTSLKTRTATYFQNLDMIQQAFAGASSEEMDWILGRTVSTWFNWPEQ